MKLKSHAPRAVRLLNGVVTASGVLSAVAIAALMLNVIADSSLRFLFSTPIKGTLDYAQFWWMITIGFGALGLAHRQNEHIEATFLADLMPQRLRRYWIAVQGALLAAFLSLMMWYGLQAALSYHASGEYAAGSGVLIWPFRYWVPVGAAVFALALIVSVTTRFATSAEAQEFSDDAIEN